MRSPQKTLWSKLCSDSIVENPPNSSSDTMRPLQVCKRARKCEREKESSLRVKQSACGGRNQLNASFIHTHTDSLTHSLTHYLHKYINTHIHIRTYINPYRECVCVSVCLCVVSHTNTHTNCYCVPLRIPGARRGVRLRRRWMCPRSTACA